MVAQVVRNTWCV